MPDNDGDEADLALDRRIAKKVIALRLRKDKRHPRPGAEKVGLPRDTPRPGPMNRPPVAAVELSDALAELLDSLNKLEDAW